LLTIPISGVGTNSENAVFQIVSEYSSLPYLKSS
jgi:hypothetical protein